MEPIGFIALPAVQHRRARIVEPVHIADVNISFKLVGVVVLDKIEVAVFRGFIGITGFQPRLDQRNEFHSKHLTGRHHAGRTRIIGGIHLQLVQLAGVNVVVSGRVHVIDIDIDRIQRNIARRRRAGNVLDPGLVVVGEAAELMAHRPFRKHGRAARQFRVGVDHGFHRVIGAAAKEIIVHLPIRRLE